MFILSSKGKDKFKKMNDTVHASSNNVFCDVVLGFSGGFSFLDIWLYRVKQET